MATAEHCPDDYHRSSSLAVKTVDAAKSYKVASGRWQKVFDKVNLTVPQRSIYALLGASGCGKTSLLRCIVGRLQLDSGRVFVFGQRPGTACSGISGRNLGYMIQDSSVEETLTIFECWRYYGVLVGMSERDVDAISGYFIQTLRLPSGDTINGHLSGGQRRRVMFVATVLHRPKLLILDEPTVGIDPITKRQMWRHLEHLVSDNGTTVLLTTHYIEEAHSAHRVGIMHGCTLAVEDDTEQLLAKYGSITLEDVMLQVHSEDIEPGSGPTPMVSALDDWCDDQSSKILSNFYIHWSVLKAIIVKNVLHFCRFPGALLFIILLPSAQLLFASLSFRASFGRLSIDVVNDDLGPLGNRYLDSLDSNSFDVTLTDSRSAALDSLRDGVIRAVLIFPKNFTNATLQKISYFPLITTETLLDSTMEVFTDDNVPPFAQVVHFGLLDALDRFHRSLYGNVSNWNQKSAESILVLTNSTIREVWWPQTLMMLTGALTMIVYYASAAMTVLIFSVDNVKGHLEHCFVRGVTIAEVIFGLYIVLLIILAIQTTLALPAAWVLLDVKTTANCWVLIYVLLYCHGAGGVAYGLFLSVAISHIHILFYVAGIITLLTAAITGSFCPIEAAPYLYQWAIRGLPHYYPCTVVAGLLNGKFETIREDLTLTFVCSLFWMSVFVVLTFILLKAKK